MRLIDADALKWIISNNVYKVRDRFGSEDYGMFWIGGIQMVIDAAPTIDAVPVRHGKWLPYKVRLTRSVKGGMYEKGLRCSVCNYKDGDEEYAYCPHCGAKMEEDDETY